METARVLTYTAVFEKAPEGGYVVMVPALPGCMSQGETFEEARRNIQDAIQGYIFVLQEDGDKIPTEEEHIAATVHVALPG